VIALYDGRCGLCDVKFYEGDKIENFDGEWCHDECVEEVEDEINDVRRDEQCRS